MFKGMSRLLVVMMSLAGLSASFTATSAFAEDSLSVLVALITLRLQLIT